MRCWRVRRDGSYGDFEVIDRHQVADSIGEDSREIHGLAGLRNDDRPVVAAADDTMLVAHHFERMNLFGELGIDTPHRRAERRRKGLQCGVNHLAELVGVAQAAGVDQPDQSGVLNASHRCGTIQRAVIVVPRL